MPADRLMRGAVWCAIAVVLMATVSCLPVREGLGGSKATSGVLVIAASPGVKVPLEAISHEFEALHPGSTVHIFYDAALNLRQRIAAIENSGRTEIGSGPVHLVAPAVDELLARLESKYYVLPGTRRAYASARLVLVVPESLVDAPESFESLADHPALRIAVADPRQTEVGQMTQGMLASHGLLNRLQSRLDVAADAPGVLDYVLSGHADAGIVLSPAAAGESQRVRIAAVAPDQGYAPPVHSIAMARNCPDRALCEAFLNFVHTARAQAALKRIGYGPPNENSGNARSDK